ncbi:MAG: hypothetical protein UR12_C0019G0015, partial [candidate division TM6 bacterium GW2011_GWF2_30_66]
NEYNAKIFFYLILRPSLDSLTSQTSGLPFLNYKLDIF